MVNPKVNVELLEFPIDMGDIYTIKVSDGSHFSKDHAHMPIYQIYNKISQVTEGESFSLSRTMLQCRVSTLSIARLQEAEMADDELVDMDQLFTEMELGGEGNGRPN